jgi:putative flippase GtrA
MLATVGGFLCGAYAKNYLCNKFLFNQALAQAYGLYIKHLIVGLFALILTLVMMYFLVEYSALLSPFFARLVSLGVTLLATYVLMHTYIYKRTHITQDQ